MQMSTTTTFRDRSICCMQSKSITDKQYLLKKQKKIFKKKNIKNYIILGYKFEHAKVISKSAVYAREQKKNQLRKKIYISFGFMQHSSWKSWHQFEDKSDIKECLFGKVINLRHRGTSNANVIWSIAGVGLISERNARFCIT